MARFQKSDLEAKYGITGTTEVLYNPSYEVLFNEETKPELTGYDKGQETELGAVNVMTGIYTCHYVHCAEFGFLTFVIAC